MQAIGESQNIAVSVRCVESRDSAGPIGVGGPCYNVVMLLLCGVTGVSAMRTCYRVHEPWFDALENQFDW